MLIIQQIVLEPLSVLAAVEIPAGTKHTSTKGLTGTALVQVQGWIWAYYIGAGTNNIDSSYYSRAHKCGDRPY